MPTHIATGGVHRPTSGLDAGQRRTPAADDDQSRAGRPGGDIASSGLALYDAATQQAQDLRQIGQEWVCVDPAWDATAQRCYVQTGLIALFSVELFLEYEPHVYIPQISPTPLLLVVAAGDHLTVSDLALQAYETALEPKKLLLLPGGHFDAYTGETFVRNSAEQIAWFKAYLQG